MRVRSFSGKSPRFGRRVFVASTAAVVGEEAVVAAGALVPPGMVVPPRTLVAGVPARVRRELGPEEVEHTRRNLRAYLELKTRYLAADDERELADAPETGSET